jgi:hypothetical protein
MIKLSNFKSVFALLTMLALLINPGAYAQDQTSEYFPVGSVKLVYNYPTDSLLKYQTTGKIVQDMDINGQSMLVNISSFMRCGIKSTGLQNDKLTLEVIIDSMAQDIDSPQGTAGGNIEDVKDKTFRVVIAANGKITDLSEAATIPIVVPGSGESDASQTFTGFFPVLPDMPVKVGDTWVTHDTSDIKSKTMTRWMSIESNCKFDGYEDFNGIQCARINATTSGTMKITTESQGMNINTSGSYTGERTLLFAVKKGYYVKETVKSKLNGIVEITDQGMSFPLEMDINTTNELVK